MGTLQPRHLAQNMPLASSFSVGFLLPRKIPKPVYAGQPSKLLPETDEVKHSPECQKLTVFF